MRVLIKQKKIQLTVDEILFFDSLSARFKPWYHSWPYVLELTTINLCLKIVIFTVHDLNFQLSWLFQT